MLHLKNNRNRHQHPLRAQQARSVLKQTIGSISGRGVAFTVILVFMLGWATDAGFEITKQIFLNEKDNAFTFNITIIILFMVLLLALIIYTKLDNSEIHFHVETDDNPPQAKALIIYLSSISEDAQGKIRNIIDDTGKITDEEFHKRFDNNWRVTVEALAQHAPRLKHLIVIPSTETSNTVGLLEKLVSKKWPGQRPPRITTVGQIDPAFNSALDYNDITSLVQATNEALLWLRKQQKIASSEIFIDITSGTKPATIAGATAALADGIRFQYVAREGSHCVLRGYNPTYFSES